MRRIREIYTEEFARRDAKRVFGRRINYIVDLVYEFYEEGFPDEDDDKDIEIDEDELLTMLLRMPAKTRSGSSRMNRSRLSLLENWHIATR